MLSLLPSFGGGAFPGGDVAAPRFFFVTPERDVAATRLFFIFPTLSSLRLDDVKSRLLLRASNLSFCGVLALAVRVSTMTQNQSNTKRIRAETVAEQPTPDKQRREHLIYRPSRTLLRSGNNRYSKQRKSLDRWRRQSLKQRCQKIRTAAVPITIGESNIDCGQKSPIQILSKLVSKEK